MVSTSAMGAYIEERVARAIFKRLGPIYFMPTLLLLKPAAQAQIGKTKLFISCFRNNPTSTCAMVN